MVRSVSPRGIAFKFLRAAQENKRLLAFIQAQTADHLQKSTAWPSRPKASTPPSPHSALRFSQPAMTRLYVGCSQAEGRGSQSSAVHVRRDHTVRSSGPWDRTVRGTPGCQEIDQGLRLVLGREPAEPIFGHAGRRMPEGQLNRTSLIDAQQTVPELKSSRLDSTSVPATWSLPLSSVVDQ